jgi:hypothetical protein
MAPLVYRKRDDIRSISPDSSQTADAEGKRSIMGFKIVHVFDVTQTEGDELPEFAKIGGEPGQLLELSGGTDSLQRHCSQSTKCCRAEPRASHAKVKSESQRILRPQNALPCWLMNWHTNGCMTLNNASHFQRRFVKQRQKRLPMSSVDSFGLNVPHAVRTTSRCIAETKRL